MADDASAKRKHGDATDAAEESPTKRVCAQVCGDRRCCRAIVDTSIRFAWRKDSPVVISEKPGAVSVLRLTTGSNQEGI